jgi:hypothetical protein
MSAGQVSCQYCTGRHASTAEVRYCAALSLIMTNLGAHLLGDGTHPRHDQAVDRVVKRDARRRAAGMSPRGRRAVSRERRPARPLVAPVEGTRLVPSRDALPAPASGDQAS